MENCKDPGWGCGHDCRDTTCTGCKVVDPSLAFPKRVRLVPTARPSLPDDAKAREEYPMAGGLLDYFPNALAEVSRLSFVATQQHHSDQPMHWDRTKSRDHRSKIIRHLIDTGKVDDKGMRHSAMVAWRALALLQEELEEQEGYPMSRASRTGMPSNPHNA